MLKILQARLQQYVNCELPDVPAGFRKGRGTRDQIANIRWIMEKAREFQKNIYLETVETVSDFILGGSKITADGDCSHEIKRHLLLGWKAMTNLDSVLKRHRHYLANKGPSSQGNGFSSHVWMWELDRKLSTKELMLLNYGVGEDPWEFLGQQQGPPRPS